MRLLPKFLRTFFVKMKFLHLLVCLSNLITLSHQHYNIWKQYKNDIFLFIQTPANYESAKVHCQSFNMMLAKIVDSDVNDFLKTTTTEILANTNWLIGVNDEISETNFVNADDTPVNYQAWEREEPNGNVLVLDGNEDCVVIKGGLWFDEICTSNYPYICHGVSTNLIDEYNYYKGHIHVFVLHGMKYNDKTEYCGSINMMLASVDDEEHNIWLRSTARSIQSSAKWMLGINDIQTEGAFVNMDGSNVNYEKWFYNEPNGGTHENCANYWRSENDYWDDANCDIMIPFICRGPVIQVYKQNNEDTFAFILTQKDNIGATYQCQLLGMNLAMIKSQEVNNLFSQTIQNITSDVNYLSWYIGVKRNIEGVFTNMDGTQLTYQAWGPNEPHSENCVAIFDCTWYNIICDGLYPFICQGALLKLNDVSEYFQSQKYVFVYYGMTYQENEEYCNSLNMNLVSLSTSEQIEWLWDKGSTLEPLTLWMIGASDSQSEGVFINPDGTTLVSGYWHLGEPNGGTKESCIGLLPDGTLQDVSCDFVMSFICGKNLSGKL